jgi:predicted SnoaL-like aldol condensation-catalyzing enzyme
VGVVSATDVWAVGYGPPRPGEPRFVKRTLIEHWDGKAWSIVPSADPPLATPQAELFSVFGLSSNNVWAVGFYYDNSRGVDLTLIEHWDGVSWTIVASPNPDSGLNHLRSVAGVASNDIWAVGLAGNGNTYNPFRSLIEHWDGVSWTVVSNPGLNELFGLTAIAANNVWSVGNRTASPDIIEHWDGTQWSNVPSPPPNPSGSIRLRGIAAISASDIWAVGDEVNDFFFHTSNTITEHWDGTAWTISSRFSRNSYLTSVTATGSTDVWAMDGSGLMQTQHWDGAAWSIISTPNPPPGSGLHGVAAVTSRDVWAVGWNGGTTLIERFTQA